MLNPVIVVGFGNNGTRVACWYAEAFGVHMMRHNDMMDWRPAGEFGRKWFWKCFGSRDKNEMLADFEETVLSCVPDGITEKPWGFKLAIGMGTFLVLYDILPLAKIVHVIRNPLNVLKERKIQWAGNPPSEWGKGDVLKLIPKTCKELTDRYFYIWLKFSYMCSEYYEKKTPGNYLRIRLEDLVLKQNESIAKFSEFLNMPPKNLDRINALDKNRVRVRDNPVDMDFINGWFGRLDKGQQKQIKPMLIPTLKKFGYIR